MAVDLDAIYHKHMTQRVSSDPYWQYNCAAYATAMAVNDSTLGGLNVGGFVTGRRIRSLTNEPTPDPASPGLNVGQCVYAAKKLGVILYPKTEHWDVICDRVGAAGSRAILPIYYDALDPYGCQSAGTFGHMVELVAYDADKDRMRASDPLCSVTKWYPAAALRKAAETFAHGSYINYAYTRVVPLVK